MKLAGQADHCICKELNAAGLIRVHQAFIHSQCKQYEGAETETAEGEYACEKMK